MKTIREISKEHKEIISYIIVGILTTIVSLSTYYVCVLTFLNPNIPIELQAANIISWIVAVAFAYVTNRIFVFSSKNENILLEIITFSGSRIVSLLIDMAIMFVTVSILGTNDKIAKIIVQMVVTVTNYILSKFLVFKHN